MKLAKSDRRWHDLRRPSLMDSQKLSVNLIKISNNSSPLEMRTARRLESSRSASLKVCNQLELLRGSQRTDERIVFFLLAKTRREEITRFDKARSDVEFGKMLKGRFLSPEQTELQTQLRRNIRVSPRVSFIARACART